MNQEIYDNYTHAGHPTSFSAPGALKNHYGNRYGTRPILETLQHSDAYTSHREYHKPRVTNPFYIYRKRQQIQMDLIDVSRLKQANKGTTFILVAIDSFTKKAWARPLVTKSAKDTLPAVRSIIESMGEEKPETIFFDRGPEFVNRIVRLYLQEKNIKFIHPSSEKKAAIIERFNKTLQGLIYRYLTQNQTETYLNRLGFLMISYNSRRHRTVKMAPEDAELPERQHLVLAAHNAHYTKIAGKRKKPKYAVGERVLVKNLPSNRFHRGYHPTFNSEQFEIVSVKTNMPIPMYILKSLNTNEIIEGGFYAEELQPIKGDVFKVETVLGKRRRGGKNQILVKWVGFNDTHNSWIDEGNVAHTFQS